MKIKDLDYLELIHVYKVPGLADFLSNRPDAEDFGESLDLFRKQMSNKKEFDEDTDKTIRGLHLRHNSKLVRDDSIMCSVNPLYSGNPLLIDEFESDFRNFYSESTSYSPLDFLVSKYGETQNVYINMRLIDHLSNKKDLDGVYRLYRQVRDKLFEYSVTTWNQKEATFGTALLSFRILSFFDKADWKDEACGGIVQNAISIAYLFLTRVICWPEDNSKTSDIELPITFAHRICALLKRIELLEKYSSFFNDLIPDLSTVDTLIVSDYYFAHEFSFALKSLGRKSEFKRDALDKYDTLDHSKVRPYSTCISDGKKDSVELAHRFYLRYARNEYKLDNEQIIALDDIIANGLFKKPEEMIIKEEKELIREYLLQNGIEYLYHFTEKENLDDIRRFGGLFSQRECLAHSIIPKTSSDMRHLRSKDAEFYLEDYVRLSFCERHPLIEGRTGELVLFKIKVDVAFLDSTLFSDRDAADDNHHHGPKLEDLKKIHINTVKKHIPDRLDPEYVFYQAEVMVKSFVPKEFIVNFDNPYNL